MFPISAARGPSCCKSYRTRASIWSRSPVSRAPAAKHMKLKLKAPKVVFIINGDDRKGAIAAVTTKLTEAKISITAVDAVSAGNGSFAAMLWVKAKDVDKAAAILGAR